MIQKNICSLSIFYFKKLLKYPQLLHFISSRIGGISKAPYSSLNVGFHVGDDAKQVLANRHMLTAALDIPMNSLTAAKQIHCDSIQVVTSELIGRGAFDYDSALDATDAMITNVPGVCLCIVVADCVPIVFFDPVKKVIGVAHAGWKGTSKHIAKRVMKTLQQQYNCSPRDIIVGIGPSIGPCCYSIGTEVIEEIRSVFGIRTSYVKNVSSDGEGYFDLWSANYDQLVDVGIPIKNIELSGICTYHNVELFFSERHQKGRTGRFAAGMMLLK